MLRAVLLSGLVIAGFSVLAHAEGEEKSEPADVMLPPKIKSEPAKRYSGSAPIDLSRGVSFTNGTYGTPNAEYEAISAAPNEAPGLTSANYPFAQKDRFVGIIDSLMDIYREGEQNLKSNTDTRPELVQHRQVLGAALHDKLEASEKALKAARSASESNWDEAQKNARVAFNDLQALLVRKP